LSSESLVFIMPQNADVSCCNQAITLKFPLLKISATRNARIAGQESFCCTTKFQKTIPHNVGIARVGAGRR
jgi:hypothetical protein